MAVVNRATAGRGGRERERECVCVRAPREPFDKGREAEVRDRRKAQGGGHANERERKVGYNSVPALGQARGIVYKYATHKAVF